MFSGGIKDASGMKRVPAGNYMFKINNRNTIAKCEICSKLTIKSGVVLMPLSLTLSMFYR